MCTVSLHAQKGGFLLAMNRDEQLTRVPAEAPLVLRYGEREVICPSEPKPNQGTWISVNDTGACFTLINWEAIRRSARSEPVTRGVVVRTVGKCSSPGDTDDLLNAIGLKRINPFRLIGVFPEYHSVHEWRWDLKTLEQINYPWESRQWVSSGFDEAGAQQERTKLWETALKQKDRGSREWLRRLHGSHDPERGPFSICMHRDGAATVSYAEVIVDAKTTEMLYLGSAPCGEGTTVLTKLKRKRAIGNS